MTKIFNYFYIKFTKSNKNHRIRDNFYQKQKKNNAQNLELYIMTNYKEELKEFQ